MKCSGMYEARQMIARARALDMGVMIGCMNESSCAIMAAATLAPQADHCDLDGPWLVNNNPFAAPLLEDGKIVLNDRPGLGVIRL
jgi:L-alanine-DL-glutamate epimerase-like enolase superfamily enzyme